MKPALEQLTRFINYRGHNAWLDDGTIAVYVRVAYRLNENKHSQFLDIANVNVTSTKRRTGVFTRFLEAAEVLGKEANLAGVYVENALNPILADFLRKRGYEEKIPGYDGPPSFVYLFKEPT